MNIELLLATVNWEGYFNGGIIGGLVGLGIAIVYKVCFGGPGRQA